MNVLMTTFSVLTKCYKINNQTYTWKRLYKLQKFYQIPKMGKFQISKTSLYKGREMEDVSYIHLYFQCKEGGVIKTSTTASAINESFFPTQVGKI